MPQENRIFCVCEKAADQLCNKYTADKCLIAAYVFSTQIVKSLFLLNPKFQASSLLLCLHRLVYVEPCWKQQQKLVFSCGSLSETFVSDGIIKARQGREVR